MPWLTLLIVLPMIGALLLVFTPPARAARIAAVLFLAELLLALATVVQVDPADHTFQLQERFSWIPTLGIHYHLGVDGLAALFLPLSALLFGAVHLASWRLREMPGLHALLLLLLQGATMGVFTALDTMLFFLFWELTLVPIYFLISLWGIGPHRRQAAVKYTLVMLAGGVPLLFGLLLAALQGPQPRFDLPSLLVAPLPPELQVTVFLLLVLGFGVKTPVFPLHSWLPTVAMEGSAGVAAIMTGLKLGAFGLLRFAIPMAPLAARELHWLLAGLGVAGLVYGGLAALVQTNMRRMLAYASISHVGLVVLGLSSLSLSGVQGAVFQLLNFALVSGGLFCLAGFLQQRFGSNDLIHMGGLARSMPMASTLFLVLGLGSLGAPLTAGFPAELLLLLAALSSHMGAGLAAMGGVILGAAYFLGFYRQAFLGPLRHAHLEHGPDLLPREAVILWVLGGVGFVGGIWPQGVLEFTRVAAQTWVAAIGLP